MSDLVPTVARVTYSKEEKSRAAAWKRSTPTLPAAAKVPAPYIGKDGTAGQRLYEFCLPPEFASFSLLPEVRVTAPVLFTELAIPSCRRGRWTE